MRGRAVIFLAKLRKESPLHSLDLRRAQCAVCVKQVALSQPCKHGAFDIAECVAGPAARDPGERLFEEGHLALKVQEEVIVEAATVEMSYVAKCERKAPIKLLCEQGFPEIGAHEA